MNIENFTKEIDRLAANADQAQRESQALHNLIRDLPDGFPKFDSYYWHNSARNEFSLTYRVNSLTDVKALFEQMTSPTDIQPLYLERGAFTSFTTKGEGLKPIYPVIVRLSQYEMTFEFYILHKGHLLSVHITVNNFQQYARVSYYQYRKHTRVERVQVVAPSLQGYQQIKWATGGYNTPNDFTLYWDTNVKAFDEIFRGEQ